MHPYFIRIKGYVYKTNLWKIQLNGNTIIMIRADFQQGMESVSLFEMNTVTENYWLIYVA